MSGLSFRCSYTAMKDVEGDSPCGRPATRRATGDPKCAGHWATEYVIKSLARTDHARKTWAFLFYWLTATEVGAVVSHMTGWQQSDTAPPVYLACLLAFYFGGLFLLFFRERPLGGMTYLLAAPVTAVAAAADGIGQMPAELTSSGTVRAFAFIAAALMLLTQWVSFLLFYAERHRSRNLVILLGGVLCLAMVVAVLVVTVVSGGAENDLITMLLVLVGVLVVAGGTSRLKRIAQHLRV